MRPTPESCRLHSRLAQYRDAPHASPARRRWRRRVAKACGIFLGAVDAAEIIVGVTGVIIAVGWILRAM